MRAFEEAGLVTTTTVNFSIVDDEGNVKFKFGDVDAKNVCGVVHV